MKRSTVFFSRAGRYAKALLELDPQENMLPYFEALRPHLLPGSPTLLILQSTHIQVDQLSRLMEEIQRLYDFPDLFIKFMKVLIEQRVIGLFDLIYKCYKTLWREYHRLRVIKIYTPSPLHDSLKEMIELKISRLFEETLTYQYHIDPSLLGGILIDADQIMIDASHKHAFKTLQKEIIESFRGIYSS